MADLGASQTTDTLTRWLAHHTARLIEEADQACAAGQPDADARTADARTAILQLWEHRSAWPNGWPPSRATAIVHLFEDLPDLEDPGWFNASPLSRLQNLHHHVLAGLADLVAGSSDGLEEGWLQSFGDYLTVDEVTLLTRAASAPQRLDMLLGRNSFVTSRLRRSLMVGDPDPVAGHHDAEAASDTSAVDPEEDNSPSAHPLVQLADAYRDSVHSFVDRIGGLQSSVEVADRQPDEVAE